MFDDDENKKKITTGAIVTLNVLLKRQILTHTDTRTSEQSNQNSKTNIESFPGNFRKKNYQFLSRILSIDLDTNENIDEDELFLDKFQEQQRRKEKLETKEKISHRVFCPFYPGVNLYLFGFKK